MGNAFRDQNFIPGKLAVLNTDTVQGVTKVPIKISEANGGLEVDMVSTISFIMQPIDAQDENYVDCWLFEGSDGLTYPAVATATGNVLIDA